MSDGSIERITHPCIQAFSEKIYEINCLAKLLCVVGRYWKFDDGELQRNNTSHNLQPAATTIRIIRLRIHHLQVPPIQIPPPSRTIVVITHLPLHLPLTTQPKLDPRRQIVSVVQKMIVYAPPLSRGSICICGTTPEACKQRGNRFNFRCLRVLVRVRLTPNSDSVY